MAHNSCPLHLRLTIAFLLFLCPNVTLAQNVREGFVWGGGLGASVTAHWEIDGWSEQSAGFAGQLMIGYLVSHRNLLCLEGDDALVHSSTWDATATHSFVGPVWYHYYGRPGRSVISQLGIGWYQFDANSDMDRGYCPSCPPPAYDENGLGWIMGLGYEFHRNWQCLLTMSLGHAKAGQHISGLDQISNDDYSTYFLNFVIARVSN